MSVIVGTSSAVTLLSVCAPWSDIEGTGAVNDEVGTSSAVTLVCPVAVRVLVDVKPGMVWVSASLVLSGDDGSSTESASSISSASMVRSTGSSKDVSLQGYSSHPGTGTPAALQVARAS